MVLATEKMFTLLRGLWKYFFRKDEYCVVILGLNNAGKTVSLITHFQVASLSVGNVPLFSSQDISGENKEYVYY